VTAGLLRQVYAAVDNSRAFGGVSRRHLARQERLQRQLQVTHATPGDIAAQQRRNMNGRTGGKLHVLDNLKM